MPKQASKKQVKKVIVKRTAKPSSKVAAGVAAKSGSLAAKVYSIDGKAIGSQSLSKEIFDQQNLDLVNQSLRTYLANQRKGTASTKTRAEVSGGGRKPWKQKGTGRARQGSIRSPQWKHGGIVHGPKPRSYVQKLNKKMKKQALFGALTLKKQSNDFIVISNLEKLGAKTKDAVKLLEKFETRDALLVLENVNEKLKRAFSNLPKSEIELVRNLNPYKILVHQKVIFEKGAISQIGKNDGNLPNAVQKKGKTK